MSTLERWDNESVEGSVGQRMSAVLLRGVELGVWTREQAERAAEDLSVHMLRPVERLVDEIREDLARDGGPAS